MEIRNSFGRKIAILDNIEIQQRDYLVVLFGSDNVHDLHDRQWQRA